MRFRSGMTRSEQADLILANTGMWLFVGLRVSEGMTSELRSLGSTAPII
jgi:hypothetical protein